MRQTFRILLAFTLAAWGHRKQNDKAGKASIWHLVTVAWLAFGLTGEAEAVVVGLLHDHIEDVSPEAFSLLVRLFGTATAARVQILTREATETYSSYAQDVSDSGDRIVIAVKVSDLLHNSDGARCYPVGAAETTRQSRITRYLATLQLMLAARAAPGGSRGAA